MVATVVRIVELGAAVVAHGRIRREKRFGRAIAVREEDPEGGLLPIDGGNTLHGCVTYERQWWGGGGDGVKGAVDGCRGSLHLDDDAGVGVGHPSGNRV